MNPPLPKQLALIPSMSLYGPINSAEGEIRLLSLLPGDEDTPIACRLEPFSLSSNLEYLALSYASSSPSGFSEIIVNDTLFRVCGNTFAALHRLRHYSQPRKVWIDAICINQQDHVEKAHQILLVHRIYQQALRVSVWLGESTALSGLGMKRLAAGADEREFIKVPTIRPKRVISEFETSPREREVTRSQQEVEWAQVRELFARPWWTDVWAIQAAVLAKSLVFMCGPDTATWDSVKKVKTIPNKSSAEVFDINLNSSDPVFETFHAIKRLREKRIADQWDVSIYELMYDFRHLSCENQRDKIYAFLSIGSNIPGLDIIPNYNDSTTTARAYTDFARKILHDTGSLDILNCAWEWRRGLANTHPTASSLDEMSSLPSWVPNWTTKTPHDPTPLLNWSSSDPLYSAAGSLMKAQLRSHPNPSTLVLGGIRFDQITILSDPWHPSTLTISRPSALAEWEPLALTPHATCPYNGARDEALWRTYTTDFTGTASAPPHHSAYLECWYDRVGWTPTTLDRREVIPKWTKHITHLHKQSHSTRNPLRLAKNSLHLVVHGEAEYGAYLQRIQAACAHRRLLVTRRGWMGLAPWNAEVGDVVVVLYGGKTPYVLRPRKLPGEYEFVGECFVQGIMGGEALGWEFATAAARDFRIC